MGMEAPDGNIRFETLTDGTAVRFAHWPASTRRRGRVVICHGRTEFIEKYSEVTGELRARGFDVWSMDWRGQGGSGRSLVNSQKGHIDRFETYIDDLEWFIEMIGASGDGNTVLIGHSMGGHIALRAVLEGRVAADRVILTAPMIDLPMTGLSRAAVAWLCRLMTRTGFGSRYVVSQGDYDLGRVCFDGNVLTSDQRRFDAIHAAIAGTPGVVMGGVTYGWLNAVFSSIGKLQRVADTIPSICPILMCTAMADTIVSVNCQTAISNILPTCKQVRIDGARHEIFHETDAIRSRFWDAFDRFTEIG